MPNRGALLVLVMVATGVVLGGSAVWYHRQQTRRPLELWGTDGSLLIERAPEVMLYRLVPVVDDVENGVEKRDAPKTQLIDVRGQQYRFSERREISKAAGFSHVRWGLCQDSSFDWEATCDACDEPNWSFAIRFTNGDGQIMLALDTRCGTITQLGNHPCVSITPIAAEVEIVLLRQLPDETSTGTSND